MKFKTQLSNVKINIVSNDDKENCAPFIIPLNRKKNKKKKIIDENRVLKDVTCNFFKKEASSLSVRLR